VFARDGPPVLEDEIEDLLRHAPHLLEPARRLEIDERADVQAAHRAVAVVGSLAPCLAMMSRKRGTKTGKYAGSTAVSSMKAMGLASPLVPRRSQPGLAELPDGLLLRRVQRDMRGIAEAAARALRLERLDFGPDLAGRIARVLDDQDRPRSPWTKPMRFDCSMFPRARSRIILSVSSTA